jgi:Glyoxalase-like domain
MTLPMPTLDHVIVNVRDRLDDAWAVYQRLGFTMTPRGYHTLGSMNHLAILGTEYLELIAARSADGGRAEIMGAPVGLNGVAFGTEDAGVVFDALNEVGVPVLPPLEFSRPVALPGDTRDAAFRTVRLPFETTEAGRLFFCHHLTRNLVWRDEWRHHANGAIGVERAVIVADDPSRLGGLFGRMFGSAAVRPIEAGCALMLGLSRVEVITATALAMQVGPGSPAADGRHEYMAALTLRTRSLDLAADATRTSGAICGPQHVVVPAEAAFGVTLEFRE